MNKSQIIRTAMAAVIALSGLIGSVSTLAGSTSNSRVSWVNIIEDRDLVRVKLKAGISRPAACQSERHMVFKLSSPNAKTYLATLYSASSVEDTLVRLYGSGSCDLETGAETITGIVIYPAK